MFVYQILGISALAKMQNNPGDQETGALVKILVTA